MRVVRSSTLLLLLCCFTTAVFAQSSGWTENVSTSTTTTNDHIVVNGSTKLSVPAAIGTSTVSSTVLRLTVPAGTTDTAGSGASLALGSASAQWWLFRQDTGFNLHIDRQYGGWSEGVVVERATGNVGIGPFPYGTMPAGALSIRRNSGYASAYVDSYDTTSYSVLRLNSGGGETGAGGALSQMGSQYTLGSGAYGPGKTTLVGWETGGLALVASQISSGAIRMYTAGTTDTFQRMQIAANGQVIVGNGSPANGTDLLTVLGDMTVTGNIGAKYQDLAEWVPAKGELGAGTVVVVNPEGLNEVMASSTAYDTSVAGVVSPRPGVILGEPAPTKAIIATTGRVRVRVDATQHPIHAGDLLVTSDKPGMAMYSEPLAVGGAKMHRPGTIIGKALEPLASGTGEILVLLSLQ